MMRSIYINSQGGLGFNLALSHILPELKEHYERVCVLSPYFDVFESSAACDATYKPPELRDFIFDAKADDAKLICERMYDSEDFIYKKVSYADAWRKAAGVPMKGNSGGSDTTGDLHIYTKYPGLKGIVEGTLQAIAEKGYEDFIICQFSGGQSPLVQVPTEEREVNGQKQQVQAWEKMPYDYQNEPLKRHYPHELAAAFCDLFAQEHTKTAILLYQLPNEPRPAGNPSVFSKLIPYLCYYELAKDGKCRGTVSIDSSLQHLVAGATKSVVIWGHSLPDSFGYAYNRNIIQHCRRDDILYFSALGPSGARIDYIKPKELLKEVDGYLFCGGLGQSSQ